MTDATAPRGAGTAGATQSDDPVVQELSHLMPALWRTLLRATRGSDRMPALESQVSILRRLSAAGRLSPAQLAEELHLARPTISNLLRGLVSEGIVQRERSPSDGRSVSLTLTDRGRGILETFRRGRAETLAEALDAIPAGDRELIIAALPAFEVLLHRLEDMSGGEPV